MTEVLLGPLYLTSYLEYVYLLLYLCVYSRWYFNKMDMHFRLVLRDLGQWGYFISRSLWCLAVIGTIYNYIFHER